MTEGRGELGVKKDSQTSKALLLLLLLLGLGASLRNPRTDLRLQLRCRHHHRHLQWLAVKRVHWHANRISVHQRKQKLEINDP